MFARLYSITRVVHLAQVDHLIRVASTITLLLAAGAAASSQRDEAAHFTEAHAAYRAGAQVRLARAADQLRDSELLPWVESWQLRLRMEEGNDQGVRDFLNREGGTYLGEKLRAEWLRQLGKREDWATFQQEYPAVDQPDQDLECFALRARLVGRQDTTALDEAQALWENVLDQPEACAPLMDRLVAEQRLTSEDVWKRLRRQIETRRYSAARTSSALLPASEAIDLRKLDSATDTPQRYLIRLPTDFAATRPGRELALFAVLRLSRSDPQQAAAHWQTMQDKYGAEDRAYIWGQIAWRGALDHHPDALKWFTRTNAAKLSDEQQAWRARAALRARDWLALEQTVAEMPEPLIGQPEWLYWLGRAQAALGHPEAARALFERIANQPDYYGQLASEELGLPLSIPVAAETPRIEELAVIAANRGLRRALAVLATGPSRPLRIEAVREWSWHLRGMDDRTLLAAAEYAMRKGAIDRAIAAADRTRNEHDFGMRYPAPFRQTVSSKALAATIDDAWVYGVMRQESRFVVEASSSAGARGLMQLMPATARWVANKTGYPDFRPERVADIETNIALGTSYLRMVLDKLSNQPVLATAAYNAGPRRAQRWIGDQPLEGAIYVETIPYNETRDYVKRVMSNAVNYALLFEAQPQSLKARLGTIKPESELEVANLP